MSDPAHLGLYNNFVIILWNKSPSVTLDPSLFSSTLRRLFYAKDIDGSFSPPPSSYDASLVYYFICIPTVLSLLKLILNTCEEPLHDKIRECLVAVNPLEVGGPLVLKKILDIVMDVDDSAIRALIRNLQLL